MTDLVLEARELSKRYHRRFARRDLGEIAGRADRAIGDRPRQDERSRHRVLEAMLDAAGTGSAVIAASHDTPVHAAAHRHLHMIDGFPTEQPGASASS